MNREDIISMAREAGCDIAWAKALERFAALVAAAEREACAKVCAKADRYRGDYFAEIIRARGQA